MSRYRGKHNHRQVHPKIYVFFHTERHELEYFRTYKDYLGSHLLVPKKKVEGDPCKLIDSLIKWKKENINEEDGDMLWFVFDVDDFYCDKLVEAIKEANKNGIKIAFSNECFELWLLLHFQKPSGAISRDDFESKIRENVKGFKKGQNVFDLIIKNQDKAIENAKQLLNCSYEEINWSKSLSEKGNPSTSIHFLVEFINKNN